MPHITPDGCRRCVWWATASGTDAPHSLTGQTPADDAERRFGAGLFGLGSGEFAFVFAVEQESQNEFVRGGQVLSGQVGGAIGVAPAHGVVDAPVFLVQVCLVAEHPDV